MIRQSASGRSMHAKQRPPVASVAKKEKQQQKQQQKQRHDGFWIAPKPRAAQRKRCFNTSKRGDIPQGLADANRLVLDAFDANEASPMEAIFCNVRGDDRAPTARVMTVFEFLPEGVVLYSNPGAKVDELRADPRVNLLLWCPLLGGFASIDGLAHIGDAIPAPPTLPGKEPPCPCEVPSGHPITIQPTSVIITRFEGGKFQRHSYEK